MGGSEERERTVPLRMRSSLLEMWCKWGNGEVPCNCLGYGQVWRCGIPGKHIGSSGACCGSFSGNGDRQPSTVCENLGGVHRPGLRLGPGSLKGKGHQRYSDSKNCSNIW